MMNCLYHFAALLQDSRIKDVILISMLYINEFAKVQTNYFLEQMAQNSLHSQVIFEIEISMYTSCELASVSFFSFLKAAYTYCNTFVLQLSFVCESDISHIGTVFSH